MVSASAWVICVLTKNDSVSGDRKTRKLMLIPIPKRLTWYYFTIWSIQRNIFHQWWQNIVVQHRLHRFAYVIIRIILCYWLWFTHAIPPLYFNSMSSAPELNTGNIALAETTSEAYKDFILIHQTCRIAVAWHYLWWCWILVILAKIFVIDKDVIRFKLVHQCNKLITISVWFLKLAE